MRQFSNFITKSCLYTVLFLTVFFLFAAAFDSSALLPASSYFLFLAFGALTALVDSAVGMIKSKPALRFFAHYLGLLAIFCCVMLITQNDSFKDGGIIVSIFVFSILYFGFRGLSILLKRVLPAESAPTAEKSKKNDKNEYTSRFSG